MDFMGEEMNLLLIAISLDFKGALNDIFNIISDIEDDDMKKLAEVLIGKLDIIPETEFREISFDETFDD